MTNEEILLVLRDAFERAESSDPEQEANPSDVEALLLGLRNVIELAKQSQSYHELSRALARQKPAKAIDTLAPEAGGWRVMNVSEKFFGADLDDGSHASFPPGESYLPASFTGTFPDDARGSRQAIGAAVESGEVLLVPPGAPDTSDWREKLSHTAWTRRAQCVAERADLLRECLPHLSGAIHQSFARILERLESKPSAPGKAGVTVPPHLVKAG